MRTRETEKKNIVIDMTTKRPIFMFLSITVESLNKFLHI